MQPEAPTQTPSLSPLPQITPARIQTRVSFVKGFVAIGEHYGVLEWGADNRVRLFEFDRTTGQVLRVVFDVSLSDIRKISGLSSSMTINLPSQKYTVNFSTTSTVAFASLGLVGMAVSAELNKAAGLYEWLDAFRSHNVRITFLTYKKMLGLSFAFASGFVLLIIIASVVVTLLTR